MGEYATHYTDEELKAIQEQWLKDKKRIDEDFKGRYHYDTDKEYERHLNNAKLRKLFHNTVILYRGMHESGFSLHPNEESDVVEVYRRITERGYYTTSKIRESAVSAHFGKAISRQYKPHNK